jgi:hypothetical protein
LIVVLVNLFTNLPKAVKFDRDLRPAALREASLGGPVFRGIHGRPDSCPRNSPHGDGRLSEAGFAGDTIRAETKVAALRDSKSRPNQGIVTFERQGFNQRDEVVATCRRVALMQRRPA